MSSDTTALGDRMKAYEQATRAVLPRRTYTIIRVDIRAAHTLLRGAERPFDQQFMSDMDHVAETLAAEVSGTVFAYTQSDEISLLVTDFAAPGTQPWFAGQVQKITSITAGTASVALTMRRPDRPAVFDARVFTIPDPAEVAAYFLWRQRDCVRNSISMAAQARFSPKQLHGVNSGRMQEMLWSEHGINWNDYPDGCKRGRVTVRKSGQQQVTYTHKRTGAVETVEALRSWWETMPAPHFTTVAGSWLADTIPSMPSLREAA